MKLLLYCTKAKPYLYKTDDTMIEKMNGDYHTQLNKAVLNGNCLNGKIVAECDFEVEEIEKGYGIHHTSFDEEGYFDDFYDYMTKTIDEDILLKRSCLNVVELETYNPNYAIHIKNLHIFDEPRELSDYLNNKYWNSHFGNDRVSKAPQNMMRVYKLKDIEWEEYILISIRPEWLCKILNREKTIEVRKKVLKEVLE